MPIPNPDETFKRDVPLDPTNFVYDATVSGVKVRIEPTAKVWDYLKLFLTNMIMDIIVMETNGFGAHKHADWVVVTDKDIWRVFGLVLLIGLVKKPTLKSYWSTNPILLTPIFNQTMPRDLFYRHLGAIHFVDNATERGDTKLFKLGNIYSKLCERFIAVFHSGQQLSIDESLMAWKGRSASGSTYLRKDQGSVSNFLFSLMLSPDTFTNFQYMSVMRKKRLLLLIRASPTIIVMILMEGLLRLGHFLFMDNYYNSPDLADDLVANQTHVCGTLRSNRKRVPKDLQKLNGRPLKKGQVSSSSNDNGLVGCWRDKKFVSLISTFHKTFDLVDSGKTTRDGAPIMKPQPFLEYNKNMGGVDKSDQVLHYYDAARKAMKVLLPPFRHLCIQCCHSI